MESFKITAMLEGKETEMLVVPGASDEKSLFHLIALGHEVSQIEYSDDSEWQIIAGEALALSELHDIARKIEDNY